MGGGRYKPSAILCPTTERAFELARGGEHVTVLSVEKALIREGHKDAPVRLYGRPIRNAINQLCREAAGLPPIRRA